MNLYPPAPTTIVFAGIPIGVAYAQEPPITHAISTALGSAPIPCAIDRQIGTIRAVVAVFDIKFVRIQQRMNTTNVSTYGDGFSPSAPITLLAISSPAPVSCSAAARESVPPKRKIVLRSMDLSPIVTIEREDQYVSSVNTDNYMGGVQATSLLAKIGADVLIHINAEFSSQIPSYGRIKGFTDICKEYKIPHELILTDTGHSYEETSQILKNLIEDIDIRYTGKTKGIFLPNDTFANIVLHHLIRRYGKLPDDYKLIGFDDSPVSREAIVPISTVGQQIDKIAAAAMEILNVQIKESHKRKPALSSEPVHQIIPPVLIHRETTLPVKTP